MADWLYKKKVTSIAAMTNIASAKRALLEKNFEVGGRTSFRLDEVGGRDDQVFVSCRS